MYYTAQPVGYTWVFPAIMSWISTMGQANPQTLNRTKLATSVPGIKAAMPTKHRLPPSRHRKLVTSAKGSTGDDSNDLSLDKRLI